MKEHQIFITSEMMVFFLMVDIKQGVQLTLEQDYRAIQIAIELPVHASLAFQNQRLCSERTSLFFYYFTIQFL